jgi:hypothetical protein
LSFRRCFRLFPLDYYLQKSIIKISLWLGAKGKEGRRVRMSREGSSWGISYRVVPVRAYRAEITNTLFTNTILKREANENKP